ncbi:1-acyl-sn-glycerol-3-phosphate acyltransferase [Smaragdicoccus niigatensis]|uniref:1-acyl-sn-glycerol-3-phosphate acyltransferase n=1 Tax=Smaragdicoccus niigatensis TaxID=359359 RepID=UPI0003749775|nr:1-acyl-sn-glycerol-3-phosphate acyltransferase [Smaragdicoccus niigatensis]
MSVPLPPRWLRRSVIVPLWLPVGVVLIVVFALIAMAAAVVAPITPRRRVLRLAAFAVIYLAIDLGLIVACTGLWLRHPTPAGHETKEWDSVHTRLLFWTLSRLLKAARVLFAFDVIVEEPPDAAAMRSGGPLLVLARHAGPGDSFTIAYLLMSRYRRRPRIVLKDVLQFDPGLDMLLNRMSSCFLHSRTGAGDDLADQVATLAADLENDDALLIFPEGMNWTPRRRRRAIRHLRRSQEPEAAAVAEAMTHVLCPRPGGVLAALDARPDAGAVIVAHTGLDTLVTPRQVWKRLPLIDTPMRLHWWFQPPGELPAGDAERVQWLERQWTQVDQWVEERQTP